MPSSAPWWSKFVAALAAMLSLGGIGGATEPEHIAPVLGAPVLDASQFAIAYEYPGALLDFCGRENLVLSPSGRFLLGMSETGRAEYRARIGDVPNIACGPSEIVIADLDCEGECIRRIQVPAAMGRQARNILFTTTDDLVVVTQFGEVLYRQAASGVWDRQRVPVEASHQRAFVKELILGPTPSRSASEERERLVRMQEAALERVSNSFVSRPRLSVLSMTARGDGRVDIFFSSGDRPELTYLSDSGDLMSLGLRPGALWQPMTLRWGPSLLAIDRHLGKSGPTPIGDRSARSVRRLMEAQNQADPPIFPIEDGSSGEVSGFHGESPGSIVLAPNDAGRSEAGRALASTSLPATALIRAAGISSAGGRYWIASTHPRGHTQINVHSARTRRQHRPLLTVECPLRDPTTTPLNPLETDFFLLQGDSATVPVRRYRKLGLEDPQGLFIFLRGGPQVSNRFGLYASTLQGPTSAGFEVLDVSYSGSTGLSAALADRLALGGVEALRDDAHALASHIARYRSEHPGKPVVLMAQSFAGIFYWVMSEMREPPQFDRVLLVGPSLRFREEEFTAVTMHGHSRLLGSAEWTQGTPIDEYLLRDHPCLAIPTRIVSGTLDGTFQVEDVSHCSQSLRPRIDMVADARHDQSTLNSREYRAGLIWLLFGDNAAPLEAH